MVRLEDKEPNVINCVNMLNNIIQMNEAINEMNQKSNQSMQVWRVPKFQAWGTICKDLREVSSQRPHNILERTSCWREHDRLQMMHLSNKMRLRMGKAICMYFESIYGMSPRPNRPFSRRR